MADKIACDIGYGQTKLYYNGKIVKFPTAISFYTDKGIDYGKGEVYDFEGDKYVVGTEAENTETFATTDYQFLYKFAPLMIYHILKQFDKVGKNPPIELRTGLALVDWDHKEEFAKRISKIKVNNEIIDVVPTLMPQGVGVYRYAVSLKPEIKDMKITIIDIGFNTINLIHMDEGKPKPQLSKSYPGHGVSSIIKPFREYLENKFKMPFSDSEVMKIAMKERFTFNGKSQDDAIDFIKDEKRKFIQKIFKSVLVDDKKTLGTSDIVFISGGGAYLLQNSKFPDNVKFIDKNKDKPEYEFQNVKGYYV